MASTFTGSDAGRAGLEITEVDGVPDIFGVNKITVSNTTLTDDGNGAVTITTGGGGVTTLSMGTTGLTPAATTAGAITVAGTLVVANGGTGAITATAQPINGQLLIGLTGADPALGSLTGGTGITITNGAGSITIDNDITNNNQLTNGAGYTTNVGTVTSITAGSNLNADINPITDVGIIDLLFDSATGSVGGGGPMGFINFPPDDTSVGPNGLIGAGWLVVNILTLGDDIIPAYIPYWLPIP